MAYPFAHWLVLPLLRRRVGRVTGADYVPRSSAFIAVANHSSWLDSAYLVAILSSCTDKKIFIIAATGKYKWLGGLHIDHAHPDQVLDVCAKKIALGHPVIIFPEGNSNPTPTLRPGKTGAARLALHTHTSIVPIGIRGTHQPNFLSSLLFFCSWWRTFSVHIGSPLLPADKTVDQLTHDIMSSISQLSKKTLSHA